MELSGDFDDWKAYGDYLRILARQALPRRIQEKLDESDLVQDALLHAYRGRKEFRGRSEAELLAWLRRILERKLFDAQRNFRRAKRDVAREQSIREALDHSSWQLEQFVVAKQATPSEKAIRNEDVLRISASLQQLSPKQREAIELHYLQGLCFSAVAHRMELNRDQAAGLIRRGVQKLKQLSGAAT